MSESRPIDEHVHRYRCGGCEGMVELTWYDGNGAVGQAPKVKCDNPMCGRHGKMMELHDVPNHEDT